MCIIHNGQLVPNSTNILLEKWKYNTVTGEEQPNIPPLCVFNNIVEALKMIKKHIDNKNAKIVFHTDVDVDGIGTTYILKRSFECIGNNNHLLLINKDKIHGIQQKHVDYFKQKKVDLIIITDSSSNEINIIKKFECDVLVIDHHELLHNDLSGYCNDGIHKYVIVNNTIDNSNFEQDKMWLKGKNISAFNDINKYTGDSDMSCGLVVYELMRIYCECFSSPKLLENLMLYQWVGVTLITDVINTLNDRNQWYMNKTVFNMEVESTLRVFLTKINSFKATLDKSFIGYSLAPLINKAIRAGASSEALNVVINNPDDILSLSQYNEKQRESIEKAIYIKKSDEHGNTTLLPRIFDSDNIMLDVTAIDVHSNYTGVIASRLGGDNNKNVAVYKHIENNMRKGSFRGKYKDVDYRGYFQSMVSGIYAQGHPGAFGFEATEEQLRMLLDHLVEIEPQEEVKPWLTFGNISVEEYGKYHITNINEFKRLGYILKIANGNSKIASKDEICIRVKASDVVLKSTKGKLFIYDVLGMDCKAFKALSGEYFNVYMEYTNEINFYIR